MAMASRIWSAALAVADANGVLFLSGAWGQRHQQAGRCVHLPMLARSVAIRAVLSLQKSHVHLRISEQILGYTTLGTLAARLDFSFLIQQET